MAENALNELTKAELQAAGEMFAVDLDPSMRKAEMVSELEASGVTYQQYVAEINAVAQLEESEVSEDDLPPLDPEDEVAPAAEAGSEEDLVLVKMTRLNPRFDVYGYTFTRDHPFVLVTEEVAERLIDKGGFEMARPREVREYYGQ